MPNGMIPKVPEDTLGHMLIRLLWSP